MKSFTSFIKIFSISFYLIINFNASSQNYTYQRHLPYPFDINYYECNSLVGDIDNDNDIDVVLTGKMFINGSYDTVSCLYINNGNLNFQNVSIFEGFVYSNGDLGDVDGDGDLDLILFGTNQQSYSLGQTHLFKFDGSGYSQVLSTSFTDLANEELKFFDMDNDGDEDLMISGNIGTTPYLKLYSNDGTGSYTEVTNTSIIDMSLSTISVADVDNDGDEDFFIRGESNYNATNTTFDFYSYIYINDGLGNFTGSQLSSEQINAGYFTDTKSDFIDGDMDGDMDLIISGNENLLQYYTNDGSGNFSFDNSGLDEVVNITYPQGHFLSKYLVFTEDIDMDGDKDFLVLYEIIDVQNSNSYFLKKLFLNDGTGHFIFEKDMHQLFIYNTTNSHKSITFLDVDNDNDLDILNIAPAIGGYNNITSQLLLYELCSESYSSIVETACFEYLSPSGKTFTSTGVYQDTILNYRFCDSIITIDLTIKDFDKTVSTINDSTLMANQNNATYQWGICSGGSFSPYFGQTNQVFSGAINAQSYQVEITYDGCVGYSDCIPFFLGVDDISQESIISIYPNPNNGLFTISFINSSKRKIEIYNLSGEILDSFISTQDFYEYNMQNFDNGVYFIKVVNDANTLQVYKLIKID